MTDKHSYIERRTGTYQAQNGEDRWLEKYFSGKRDGFYVDVGAYDGVVISNTYHFEQLGWQGILVEPDEAKAASCVANRPRSHVFRCAAVSDPDIHEIAFHSVPDAPAYSTSVLTPDHEARVRKYGLAFKKTVVPARTLDSILLEVHPDRIDFVSVDAEDGELGVLQGFDIRKWQPTVIMIEENNRKRRRDVRDLLVKNGYRFHDAVSINCIYVRARLSPRVEDATLYFLNRTQRWLARAFSSLRRRVAGRTATAQHA